jgi:biopolymer transport protein TolQ
MASSNSVSILSLISNADMVVQMVIVILFVASLFSWAIVFDKYYKFKKLNKKSDEFEKDFEKGDMIDRVFQEAKNHNDHPLAKIFLSCIDEWHSSDINHLASENNEKKLSLKNRLVNVMQVANNRSMLTLESGLNFLAIIGSSAPFVGLFGTVWGILNSFQAIAISSNTSLAVVAPGIAESLLATAIGLFAAIPAVFFYNIFTAKINQFNERAQNFSLLLLNVLSRELDK